MNVIYELRYSRLVATGWLIVFCMAGDSAVAAPDYPSLPGATKAGRAIWIDTCEGCHAYGIAGSPNPFEPSDWKARLEKKPQALYLNAINGFFGPEDTYMPPRGGNPSLTDQQVRAAVDYMLALARHQATQEEKQ